MLSHYLMIPAMSVTAAVGAADMGFPAVFMIVVFTMHIGIESKIAGNKSIYRFIGITADTAVELYSVLCQHHLLMCDKEAIEVQKILPFLSDTWPLCRIGRAVIRASQSCRQSCNKSQCPACGCRSHHSCTHAPQFSRSFPAREWGSVLQRQGACGQCP